MTAGTEPAWIDAALEAAAAAIASGHIRCKGRTLPACKEDCPCYFDAKGAISAFMQHVPYATGAGAVGPVVEAVANMNTLRQLKEAFK